MNNKKKRGNSPRAIALHISSAALAIWLFCMVCMTFAAANGKCNNYALNFYDFEQRLHESSQELPELDKNGSKGRTENYMTSLANMGCHLTLFSRRGWDWLLRSNNQTQTAMIFYDAEGYELVRTANYLELYYSAETGMQAEMPREGYAYVNVDRIAGLKELLQNDVFDKTHTFRPVMRLTGVFYGTEFLPIKIEYDANDDPADRKNREWVTAFETEPVPGEEYVVINAKDVVPLWRDDEGTVRMGRGKHESLTDGLSARIELYASNEERTPAEYFNDPSLREYSHRLDYVRHSNVYTVFGEDDDDNEETPAPAAYYVAYAVSGYPLRAAMYELLYIYILTFAVAAVAVLLTLRIIKKKFIDPVRLVSRGMDEGWNYVSTFMSEPDVWQEAQNIANHYRTAQDEMRSDKNEIARLATALDYAREAEEQRRQLSSNIAHELKTPLAIIRSYAEGLQEHIAEEKRDKYLEVIVGETERMDSMVLEMLDLSRLEAGKVKLARDVFDLSLLARGVFEKLEAAAAAKELSISYELKEDCLVNVDEARISQVIENFASNALRYTPHGGHIWVRTSFALGRTTLAVENTSPPLADEVLERVWERFYRADESRSEKSSGLGLAIAKSIVELHAGRCSAKNTKNGVEFSFTI